MCVESLLGDQGATGGLLGYKEAYAIHPIVDQLGLLFKVCLFAHTCSQGLVPAPLALVPNNAASTSQRPPPRWPSVTQPLITQLQYIRTKQARQNASTKTTRLQQEGA